MTPIIVSEQMYLLIALLYYIILTIVGWNIGSTVADIRAWNREHRAKKHL